MRKKEYKKVLYLKADKGNHLTTAMYGDNYKALHGKARGGLSKDKVHPHSFRHLFAKDFISHGGDIMTLADILGHSSLETTRIYTQKTISEQRDLLNKIDQKKKQRV